MHELKARQIRFRPTAEQSRRPTPATHPAADCRHYRGDQACQRCATCAGCDQYEPVKYRVCIMKSMPLAQLLQSLVILPELQRRFGSVQVTWVTSPDAVSFLQHHPYVDRCLTLDSMAWLRLTQERFDLAVNLDANETSAAFLSGLFAGEKTGIGLSHLGRPIPLANQWNHLLPTLKQLTESKITTPTYPRILCEGLSLPWRNERYTMEVSQKQRDRMKRLLMERGYRPGITTLGIWLSDRGFADLEPEQIASLLGELQARLPKTQLLLTGQVNAQRTLEAVVGSLSAMGPRPAVIVPELISEISEIPAVVAAGDYWLTNDPSAAAVSIGLGKPLFMQEGSAEQDVGEFYGLQHVLPPRMSPLAIAQQIHQHLQSTAQFQKQKTTGLVTGQVHQQAA